MPDNVKSFSVGYNPINKSDHFTSGDFITGQVTFELSKDCKIDSLCVKLKGKAQVKWRSRYRRQVRAYSDKHKYFSIKQFIIRKDRGNNVVSQGSHVYPFTVHIPVKDLPSSFKGSYGKITYRLEAILSRSMRVDTKAKTKFTLLHKQSLNGDPLLMTPQQSTINKKMILCTSGMVGMDVNIERTGFYQGEGIKVMASIQNRSSREIKPKFCLYKKYSYFAKEKRRVETKDILKEEGEVISPSAGQTVTRIITIPPTTHASILNCNIIKAEYRLKVYLDVKYARDPVIKFPIVILPALQEPDNEEHPSAFTSSMFG
ncbi:hypothetical protein ABVT39_022703 [Epinephelus coioides]